jgi:hypothetical protein
MGNNNTDNKTNGKMWAIKHGQYDKGWKVGNKDMSSRTRDGNGQ